MDIENIALNPIDIVEEVIYEKNWSFSRADDYELVAGSSNIQVKGNINLTCDGTKREFVRGDYTYESTLSLASIKEASSVIVISDDPCTTAFPIAGIAVSNTLAVTPPPLSIVSTKLKLVPLVNV